MMRLWAAALVTVTCGAACNAVLGLDNYRSCDGGECTDGNVASDGSPGDAGTQSCGQSADCPASSPVCSAGSCAAVVSLSRGMSNFTCAVLSDQTGRCWGQNDRAQLGNGQTSAWVAKPVTVLDSTGGKPLKRLRTIVTGLGYACALTFDETVFCWGTDAAAPSVLATQIPLGAVQQITAAAGVNSGEGTACAVHGGIASCWGFNGAGRIGCTSIDAGDCSTLQPSVVQPLSPIQLVGASNAVAAGTNTTCSITPGGGGYECFGSDSYGGMGDGTTGSACCNDSKSLWTTPTDRIEPSDFFTCFHDNMNTWACWGLSQGGAILGVARGQLAPKPHPIAQAGTYADLSPGWYHSCAITNDANENVQCWGQYDHGQLGDNRTAAPPNYSAVAVTAHGLSQVTQLGAHRNFTCALDGDGQVYCWGQNDTGWLLGANSPSGDVKEPTPVRWD